MSQKVSDRKIREAIRAQRAGEPVSAICRSLGISRATFHRRKAAFLIPEFSAIDVEPKRQSERQRSVAAENTRLRHLLVEANLKIDMLQDRFALQLLHPKVAAETNVHPQLSATPKKKPFSEAVAKSFLEHSVDFVIWDDPDQDIAPLSDDVQTLQRELLDARDTIAYCLSQLGRVSKTVIMAALLAKLGGWRAYYAQIQRNLPPEERVGGDGSKFMIGGDFAYGAEDRKEIERRIVAAQRRRQKVNRTGLQQLFQDYFKSGAYLGYSVQLIAAEGTGLDERTIRRLFTKFEVARGKFYASS